MTTKTPDPHNEIVEQELKRYGWTCGPEFWQRVVSDPFVFQLVSAIERPVVELHKLRLAAREYFEMRDAAVPLGMSDDEQNRRNDIFTRKQESELWLRSLVGVEDTTEERP